MKLFSFVLLGIGVSVGVYVFALNCVESVYPDLQACELMGIGILIILPFSVLVGGIVTGFLSCGNLETKWGMFGIAPGLYIGIVLTFAMWGFLIIPLSYLPSLVGVGLGYLLRSGMSRLISGRSD